jgi:hypothetical protein
MEGRGLRNIKSIKLIKIKWGEEGQKLRNIEV